MSTCKTLDHNIKSEKYSNFVMINVVGTELFIYTYIYKLICKHIYTNIYLYIHINLSMPNETTSYLCIDK